MIAIFMALFIGFLSCDIPVFRQALEGWTQRKYEILVYSPSGAGIAVPGDVNGTVRPVRDPRELSTGFLSFLARRGFRKGSPFVALFPLDGNDIPLFVCKPSSSDMEILWDSPARKRIRDLICRGESAVWVLLLSGEGEKDEKARRLLRSELQRMPGLLKLPAPKEAYAGRAGPEVKISFSVIPIRKDDRKERVLVSNLLGIRKGLEKYLEEGPIAFPVFGRARVLDGFPYDMLTKEKILEVCSFLVGPCTCDIEDRMAGVDLFIKASWPSFKGFILLVTILSYFTLKRRRRPR